MNPKQWSWHIWLAIVLVMIGVWTTLGILREIVEKRRFEELSEEQWQHADRETEAKWRALVDPTQDPTNRTLFRVDVPKEFDPYSFKDGNNLDAYLAHPVELFAEWRRNQPALTAIRSKMVDLPSWRTQRFIMSRNHWLLSQNLVIGTDHSSSIPWEWALLYAPFRSFLCTGTDSVLPELDRFWKDQWSPNTVINFQAASSADRIRNQAYLDLERIGHLPESSRLAWLNEQTDLTPAVINYCQTMRIPKDTKARLSASNRFSYYPTLIFHADPLTDPASFGNELLRMAGNVAGTWCFKPLLETPWGIGANMLHWSIEVEHALITNSNQCADQPAIAERYIGLTHLLAWPNSRAVRYRLAVRLIADFRAGKPLPVDHAELVARYGAQVGHVIKGPAQLYEKLADRRFRIRSADTAPVPWFTPPKTMPPISSTSSGPSVFESWYCDIEISDPLVLPLIDPTAGSIPASAPTAP